MEAFPCCKRGWRKTNTETGVVEVIFVSSLQSYKGGVDLEYPQSTPFDGGCTKFPLPAVHNPYETYV
jgi:hypothetical protein